MKLKSILVCAVAWLALGTASAATLTDAPVEELLQTWQPGYTFKYWNDIREQTPHLNISKVAAVEKFTPEQRRVFDQYVAKAAPLIGEQASSKPQIFELYREVFTQEEVEGPLAFYRSPVGQALIEKLPQLVQKTLEISQRQMNGPLPPKLQAMVQEAIAQAKATPSTAPNSSPE